MTEPHPPHACLSDEPLDLAAHIDAVAGPDAGAIATFVGTVRDHSPDAEGTVTELVYSAHPDAAGVIARIGARVAAAHPQARVAVTHRTGTLQVGEAAIVAVAASAHRAEAFEACRELVETVKDELPVWKKQMLADGTHSWVGSA